MSCTSGDTTSDRAGSIGMVASLRPCRGKNWARGVAVGPLAMLGSIPEPVQSWQCQLTGTGAFGPGNSCRRKSQPCQGNAVTLAGPAGVGNFPLIFLVVIAGHSY